MNAKQFLHLISIKMAEKARELPDNSWIDIYTMLRLTFGQSRDCFINNYGEEVLVYDNGLTIRNMGSKILRYETAMFEAFSQEDNFFIDPSRYILKYVGFLHRGVLRNYKELFVILQKADKRVDKNSGNQYCDLIDSIDGYPKRIFYINKRHGRQMIVCEHTIWITILQGEGMAASCKRGRKLRNSCGETQKVLSLVKGDYVCLSNNKYEDKSPSSILVENKGEEQLIFYVSYC